MKIGIDMGGSHIGVGLVNDMGDILAKREVNLESNDKIDANNTIISYINKLIGRVLEAKDASIDDIELIGIASPGVIKKGIIVKADNLNLNKFNIVGELKKKYNVPIYLDNDAKCAAIAEKEYGNLKGYVDSVFLCIGTGIGGAVFWDGHLLESARTPGFELGHMIIQKEGIPCKCGKKGCWEKYASIKAFKDNLREILNLDEKTSGKELLDMLRKMEKSNPKYIQINKLIEQYIEYLSIGISNLVNIFEPEAIGIGGSFVFYEEIFLEKLKEKLLKDNLLFNERKEIVIQTAILDNDAGMIGATL